MIFSSLLRIGLVCFPGYVIATDLILAHDQAKVVKNSYIIRLKTDHDPLMETSSQQSEMIHAKAFDIAASVDGKVNAVYTAALHGFAATLSDKALIKVLEDDRVLSVEQNAEVTINAVGSWGLDRIDQQDLPLDSSYSPSYGNRGTGVTVYVIDTGIMASHKEFEGRAKQQFNSVGDGINNDCNGHGTHVAGTVGAKTYGVAKKVQLVGVKVLDCYGSGNTAGVIAGIDWVRSNAVKPATANMSLDSVYSISINAAVRNLVNAGVTTVVAAGNRNLYACSYSPASEPTAITVGSTTSGDERSSWSNKGNCVDIFAPGSYITAPWIGSNKALRTLGGTSMASAHVCGAVALSLARKKSLTPSQIIKQLSSSSIKGAISDVQGSPNKLVYVGKRKKKQDQVCDGNTELCNTLQQCISSCFEA